MPTPILATKLYIPPPRSNAVERRRLIERLNTGLGGKLTLISAPAGFGKTTLASAWLAACGRPAAWLSLDESDNDPVRFLTYLVAALRTVTPETGEKVLDALQSPQPPPAEIILTALVNEIADVAGDFILLLDDYHAIDAPAVDQALLFLVEHLPPQMHLAIATREDPQLPLARLRARGQLNELRVADLRFNAAEAAGFLNGGMGLNLAPRDIAALETRTEGWIAGLQLAAISMQGQPDAARFIQSFTGSHHFVMDYLVEEVLNRQPEPIQTFLLQTSMLDRLCGALCDAVLLAPDGSGKETLDYLERANLFLIPLDSERRWYRYHHLFADLLRQRRNQSAAMPDSEAALHLRASLWYEKNQLDGEAFHHAVAAGDVDHIARLVEGDTMPLPFRGVVIPVLNWLESVPAAVLDARPSLWVIYASTLLVISQVRGVEQKLQAAEAALRGVEHDDRIRDLIGHIAASRATLAITRHDTDEILVQAHRALDHLYPHNLPVRSAIQWTLGHAYRLQGDFAAAKEAYTQSLAVSRKIGHRVIALMSMIGLGIIQEEEGQLDTAFQTYRTALEIAGEPPMPVACDAHLGLARLYHRQGDGDATLRHGEIALKLARQIETTDRAAMCEAFLAGLNTRQHDSGAGSGLIEPLSQRELEILRLVAQGLSNQEICARLFLALSTVKGHNQNIFGKLHVQRRTEAIARARELGLL